MGSETDQSIEHVEKEINFFDENLEYIKSYDRFIPGHVNLFPLTPDCKYFYSIIRSLTFKEGYCWATNKHLAAEASVSSRTIDRWIKCLKDCELIQVEYCRIKNGYENRRKIWINEALISQKVAKNETLLREIQKSLPNAKTCSPDHAKTCSAGHTQNGVLIAKSNSKEESSSKEPPIVHNSEPPDPPPDAAAAFSCKTSHVDLPKIVTDLPENEKALVVALFWKKNAKKTIDDPAGWMAACVRGGWHLESFDPPPPPEPESVVNTRANTLYANYVIKKLECVPDIDSWLVGNFLAITHIDGANSHLNLAEGSYAFRTRVHLALKNMKLSPELYLSDDTNGEDKKEDITPN